VLYALRCRGIISLPTVLVDDGARKPHCADLEEIGKTTWRSGLAQFRRKLPPFLSAVGDLLIAAVNLCATIGL
jgi:hypothetical protein